MSQRIFLAAFTSASVLALSACIGVTPQGAAGLAGFDPLSADPAGMRIAIDAPAAIRIRPGDITVTIAHKGGNGRAPFSTTFHPDIVDARPEDLPAPAEGRQVTVAAFSPTDQALLRAEQAKARTYKAATPGGGTLAVGATGCLQGQPPAKPARVTIYMQTEAGGDFIPVTKIADLDAVLRANGGIAAMPQCNGPIRPLAAD